MSFCVLGNTVVSHIPKNALVFPHLVLPHQAILEWHPYKQAFALVMKDHLYVYDLSSETWFPRAGLSHPKMLNVTNVYWNSSGLPMVAALAPTGICLWRFKYPDAEYSDIVPLIHPESLPLPIFDFLPCDSPLCLVWSPDARFLVAGFKSHISVIDLATKEFTHMKRSFHPTASLLFHPSGDWLVQASLGSELVFWDRFWNPLKFTTASPCHVSCSKLEPRLDPKYRPVDFCHEGFERFASRPD
jgi:hypothetical protein